MKKFLTVIIVVFVSAGIHAQASTASHNETKKKNRGYTSLGVMGATYSTNSDLGIAVEFDMDNLFVVGMYISMNLDSYKGIGEELQYASITELGALSSTPEYKEMSIGLLGGVKLSDSFALVAGLGYTNKREYYRMNTDYGYSKVAYHYHVETGNVYGELYASIKARIHVAKSIALSAAYGTNGPEFGLYYVINNN